MLSSVSKVDRWRNYSFLSGEENDEGDRGEHEDDDEELNDKDIDSFNNMGENSE